MIIIIHVTRRHSWSLNPRRVAVNPNPNFDLLTFQREIMSLVGYPKVIPYTKFELCRGQTNRQTNKQTDGLENSIHADQRSRRE